MDFSHGLMSPCPTGRSGWNCFLYLIPLARHIIMLVFILQDSYPGENKYGENPKAENNFTPTGKIS